MVCADAPITEFGVGYDYDYGVSRDASLTDSIDEMEWVEFLEILNEQLPGRNFGLSVTDHNSRRFPLVKDLIGHLLNQMTWETFAEQTFAGLRRVHRLEGRPGRRSWAR